MDHAYIQDKKKSLIFMILLSILFHLIIIFSTIFFASRFLPPATRPLKKFKYYEVSLVEIPKREKKGVKIKSKTRLKRIRYRISQKKEKTIIIPKKKIKIPKRRISEEKLIEQAISKIKRKVRKKRTDIIEQRISKIKSRIKESAANIQETGTEEGLSLRVYASVAKSRIKSNWIYPPALAGLAKKELEAIVILKIKRNGKIVRFWFKKRSNDAIFDRSIVKAIEKSDPLPPLPEGYKKRYEEIEIRFNLSELKSS